MPSFRQRLAEWLAEDEKSNPDDGDLAPAEAPAPEAEPVPTTANATSEHEAGSSGPPETVVPAGDQPEAITLTPEQIQSMIATEVAKARATSGRAPKAEAAQGVVRGSRTSTVPNLDTMSTAEIAEYYNKKGGLEEQLATGKETVVF